MLADSFLEHHPGARFFVLLLDASRLPISSADEPFSAVLADEIGVSDRALHRIAALDDAAGVAAALQPRFLRHLLGEETEPTAYLAPDTHVLAPLKVQGQAVERSSTDSTNRSRWISND